VLLIVGEPGARLRLMPPWLGIVATTRNDRGVLRQLRSLPVQTLEANDSKNQDDVRAFLQLRLSEPSLRAKAEASGETFQELETSLLRSSAYNFLFVVTALEAVESSKLRFDEIDRLPPGLRDIARSRHQKRMSGSISDAICRRLFPMAASKAIASS
jgi:hypothetical protein